MNVDKIVPLILFVCKVALKSRSSFPVLSNLDASAILGNLCDLCVQSRKVET